MSDSEMLLFTKERPWAIRSRSFLEKSESAIRFKKTSELPFRSFAHKKQAIRLKNRWANLKLKP